MQTFIHTKISFTSSKSRKPVHSQDPYNKKVSCIPCTMAAVPWLGRGEAEGRGHRGAPALCGGGALAAGEERARGLQAGGVGGGGGGAVLLAPVQVHLELICVYV